MDYKRTLEIIGRTGYATGIGCVDALKVFYAATTIMREQLDGTRDGTMCALEQDALSGAGFLAGWFTVSAGNAVALVSLATSESYRESGPAMAIGAYLGANGLSALYETGRHVVRKIKERRNGQKIVNPVQKIS